MKVLTTEGEIDIERLDVKDVVELADNHRKIATEFRLNGELVRRDVAISMLRGLSSQTSHGELQ